MQLTEVQEQYWQKKSQRNGQTHGRMVRGHICRYFFLQET